MTKLQKKMIEIYANNPCKKINNQLLKREFGISEFWDEYQKSVQLKTFRTRVRECKKKIEKLLKLDSNSQIQECLEIFNQHRSKQPNERKDRDAVLFMLIELILRPKWCADGAIGFFEHGYSKIVIMRDYFISYTNRGASKTNLDFQCLLESMAKFPSSEDERESQNFIAVIIDEQFRDDHLRGFFDQNRLQPGEDIKDRVYDYCATCYGFVQLVEPKTFSLKEPNWCYDEYMHFLGKTAKADRSQAKTDRCFFVVAGGDLELIEPVDNKFPDDWVEHMRRKNCCAITNSMTSSEFTQEIKRISRRIVKIREDIIGEALDIFEPDI